MPVRHPHVASPCLHLLINPGFLGFLKNLGFLEILEILD